MWNQTRYTLFIGKNFIDPGFVTLRKEPIFESGDPLAYTLETLPDVLSQLQAASSKRIRIVLAEELVYVVGLTFPVDFSLTRTLIQEKAAESIPEDLQSTEWDFQTIAYAKKSETDKETLVQVVVVKKTFAEAFKQALRVTPLPIECILPESYLLAQAAASLDGVSVIVTLGRETVLFSTVERGFVIATSIKTGEVKPDDLASFLDFVTIQKLKKVERVIFSRFSPEAVEPFQTLVEERCELVVADYNPSVIAAVQKKISGRDETVLNIDIFRSEKGLSLFQRLLERIHRKSEAR